MSYIIEVHMGHVERCGPYRTRAEAQREIDTLTMETQKRDNRDWFCDEATGQQIPTAQIIELERQGPATLLRRHLREWARS
jgi:hypothetical protein